MLSSFLASLTLPILPAPIVLPSIHFPDWVGMVVRLRVLVAPDARGSAAEDCTGAGPGFWATVLAIARRADGEWEGDCGRRSNNLGGNVGREDDSAEEADESLSQSYSFSAEASAMVLSGYVRRVILVQWDGAGRVVPFSLLRVAGGGIPVRIGRRRSSSSSRGQGGLGAGVDFEVRLSRRGGVAATRSNVCEQKELEQGGFVAVARMNGVCRPKTLLFII